MSSVWGHSVSGHSRNYSQTSGPDLGGMGGGKEPGSHHQDKKIIALKAATAEHTNRSTQRSDGKVDRTSASKAANFGSVPVSVQAEDLKKMVFTASLLGVQH